MELDTHGAAGRRGGQPEHGLHAAVGLPQAEAAVDGEDPLGNAGQDGVKFGALAVGGQIEVAGLARDDFKIALRGAQTARQIEGQRPGDIAVGNATQRRVQAAESAEVTPRENKHR